MKGSLSNERAGLLSDTAQEPPDRLGGDDALAQYCIDLS